MNSARRSTKEIKEIVASAKSFSHPKTSQLENLEYHKIGNNAIIAIEPSIVHFSGFELNQTYTQVVRVINKSKDSTRVHLFYPTSGVFHASCKKKGALSSGLSEDITISFQPKAYTYYYDCIKVHNEAENLMIPIHAYPVMNKIEFPRHYDFGIQPLGEKAIHRMNLQCSVPIQFEYVISMIKTCSEFEVYPLRGTIPANGTTSICIEFCPSKRSSFSCELMLQISQFEFEPMLCTISGSSAPGATSKKRLDKFDDSKHPSEESEEVIREIQMQKLDLEEERGRRSLTLEDTTEVTEHAPVKRTSRNKSSTKPKPKPEFKEEIMEGLKIPISLDGTTATNFVLTQQMGKLKPNDLKKAILKQREFRKQQQEEQEALRTRRGAAFRGKLSLSAILMEEDVDGTQSTRVLKERVFLQDIHELDLAEKNLEFQSQKDHLGETLLQKEEIDVIYKIRKFNDDVRNQRLREEERTCFESKSLGWYTQPPGRCTTSCADPFHRQPDFNPFKNNLWGKRKRVIRSFVQSVSRLIIRRRAQERIQKIKAFLGDARTRRDVRALVERDWQFSRMESGTSSGCKKVASIADRFPVLVVHEAFPRFIESESKTRGKVEVKTPQNFHDLNFFQLKIPDETHLMGYTAHPYPAVPIYHPRENRRRLRKGALYELGVRASRKVLVTVQEEIQNRWKPLHDPVALGECHADETLIQSTTLVDSPISILKPSPRYRIYCSIPKVHEAHSEYLLRPRLTERKSNPTNRQLLAHSLGGISMGTLFGKKTLHTMWRPSLTADFSSLRLSGMKSTGTWEIIDLPPLLSKVAKDDYLSESESDNEEEGFVHVPSFKEALSMFDEDEDKDKDKDEVECTDSQEPCQPRRIHAGTFNASTFARYAALVQMEENTHRRRQELHSLLPQKMEHMAKTIRDIRHKFTLSGHESGLPSHKL